MPVENRQKPEAGSDRDESGVGMRYAEKIEIDTGGSKGIGEGCVRIYVEAGAKVVFGARNAAAGEAMAREVTARGPGEAHFVRGDVSKVDDLRALVEGTLRRFGRIDCLINNAGWHPPPKPIEDFTAEKFRALLALNLATSFPPAKPRPPPLRGRKGTTATWPG